MRPFEVEHIREFGDGSCELRAVKMQPGFTTGDLIDYVLSRKGDAGRIEPTNHDKLGTLNYAFGKAENDYFIPEKPIKRLTLIGGYHKWDYIYEI